MNSAGFLSKTVMLCFLGVITFVMLYITYNLFIGGNILGGIGLFVVTLLLLFGGYLQFTIRIDKR